MQENMILFHVNIRVFLYYLYITALILRPSQGFLLFLSHL
jgi:hypothetical protein